MKVLTTLYILKYDTTPYNSIFKIGITGKTAEARCAEIQKTLTNGSLKVRWKGRFVGAYFIEQTLHVIYSHKNVRMPEHVSGYTEFFDLNWFNVSFLIFLLEVYQVVFLLTTLTVIWIVFNWDKFLSYL